MKNIVVDLGGVILRGYPRSILSKMSLENNEYNELIKFFKDWNDLDLGIESLNDKITNCNFSKQTLTIYSQKADNIYNTFYTFTNKYNRFLFSKNL